MAMESDKARISRIIKNMKKGSPYNLTDKNWNIKYNLLTL